MGPERLHTTAVDKSPMTRELLALEMSGRIYELFKNYPAPVSVFFLS